MPQNQTTADDQSEKQFEWHPWHCEFRIDPSRQFLRAESVSITWTTLTYCLGIITREGLVMASDSRSNAGFDQVNVCRKMYTFAVPGERVLIVLASGSLSLTQSVITLLLRDFEQGLGLAAAPSQYEACRVIGQQISRVAEIDHVAFERADFSFNIHFLLGGQIRGESPGLYMIYPQGNPLSATRTLRFYKLASASTVGQFSIAASATRRRRWKKPRSMP